MLHGLTAPRQMLRDTFGMRINAGCMCRGDVAVLVQLHRAPFLRVVPTRLPREQDPLTTFISDRGIVSMPKFSPVVSRRRRFPSLLAVIALAALTAAGCDSSTGNSDAIASLTLTPPTPVLNIGSLQQLVATPATSSGQIIEGRTATWVSSVPAVASVTPTTGLVTAIAGGTTDITATVGSESATATVTVWHRVQSLTLASAGGVTAICQEGSLALTPTYVDATGDTVTARQSEWTSANPAIAEVSPRGVIVGRDTGTVTISAVTDGVTGTFAVTVNCPPVVATVTMAATLGRYIAPTQTDRFIATARAASGTVLSLVGRTVVWTSSDTANATVDASGLVTMITSTGSSVIRVSVDTVRQTAPLTAVGRPALVSGVPFVNTTIASGARRDWVVNVPAGSTELRIVTAGGTGDPDIYIYRPALTSAAIVLTCFSYNEGPAEECIIANPAVGRWFVQLEAWDGAGASTGTTITATVTP